MCMSHLFEMHIALEHRHTVSIGSLTTLHCAPLVLTPHCAFRLVWCLLHCVRVASPRRYTHTITKLYTENWLVLPHFFYLCEIINKTNNDRPNYRFQ